MQIAKWWLPSSTKFWPNMRKKDTSSSLYQKCLILCSRILLYVLHNESWTLLLPWQHTGFQTSSIIKMWRQTIDCKDDTTWKPFWDTKHDWEPIKQSCNFRVDRCFILLGTHQHRVATAKICNASLRANAHKLQGAKSDPFTRSSSVLDLLPETHVATIRVWGRMETKCHDWCLKKQNFNVAFNA